MYLIFSNNSWKQWQISETLKNIITPPLMFNRALCVYWRHVNMVIANQKFKNNPELSLKQPLRSEEWGNQYSTHTVWFIKTQHLIINTKLGKCRINFAVGWDVPCTAWKMHKCLIIPSVVTLCSLDRRKADPPPQSFHPNRLQVTSGNITPCRTESLVMISSVCIRGWSGVEKDVGLGGWGGEEKDTYTW